MNSGQTLSLLAILLLAACDDRPPIAVGQLQSDRVEIVAEVDEPIVRIARHEGDAVTMGEMLVTQDTRRIETRMRQAEATIAGVQARLAEQVNGPRAETIAARRASLRSATIERDFRERELARLTGLRARNLTSAESVDTASKLLDEAIARVAAETAQLAELEAGTRSEQLAQTRAVLAEAQARLAGLEIDLERHRLTAPVAGLVDSLPFEVGERPRPGDVLAVLLTGDQPYARVYIPEPQRIGLQIGSQLPVRIDGLAEPLSGTVRRIAAEAAFTPYFALTERDRSRLSYVAELTLPARQQRLPEGVPVQIVFDQNHE